MVKNEVGAGGGAAHVQNAGFAACHAFQAAKIGSDCVCPTLVIHLAGPNVRLCESVCTDITLCDQLSSMVSPLWQPHSHLGLPPAWCFAALRKALASLGSFFKVLDEQAGSTGCPNGSLEHPYLTSFTESKGSPG